MKKVLFFHGMGGGEIDEETINYIKKHYDVELISPHIQYDMWTDNPHLFPLINELAKDVDCISGNSMGGYFAYHTAKKLNKPVILFNPAISEKTLSYRLFHNITEKIAGVDNKVVSNLSTNDTVVDHVATRAFLEKNDKNNTNVDLNGMTHTLSYNLILSKIINFVKEC